MAREGRGQREKEREREWGREKEGGREGRKNRWIKVLREDLSKSNLSPDFAFPQEMAFHILKAEDSLDSLIFPKEISSGSEKILSRMSWPFKEMVGSLLSRQAQEVQGHFPDFCVSRSQCL